MRPNPHETADFVEWEETGTLSAIKGFLLKTGAVSVT